MNEINSDYHDNIIHEFLIKKSKSIEFSLNETTGVKLLKDSEVLNQWRVTMSQINQNKDLNH